MVDNIAVGKTIAQLRQNQGMTQQQLAAALSVSHQAVSKWENGAALPDIDTLLELAQLFGITLEQLLSGDIPEDRLGAPEEEKAEEKPEEPRKEDRPVSPFEGAIRDIGNFVNGIFRPAEKKEAPAPQPDEEDDGAQDSVIEPEKTDEEKENEPRQPEDDFDVKRLLQMAPFMSKEAVGELLLSHRAQLTAADIARFAPFVTQEVLEKLIAGADSNITWDNLRRIAPFVKREVVDRLAQAAAAGGKAVRDAAEQTCKNPEELGKAIGDVSQKIGEGMENVLRQAQKLGENVANEVTNRFNEWMDGMKAPSRAEILRHAAWERALQDEKWDWLAAHMNEITDEALLKEIARKANGLGMHDWVLDHMNGYADTRTIDAAIEAGNWGWLGDHVWQFEDALQDRIALAAAQQENWQWLSTYAEQISLESCADEIGVAAYKAGERILALQLAERCMNDDQRKTLASAAVEAGDGDFLHQMEALLAPEFFGQLCLSRAQTGDWDGVKEFIALSDKASIEQMMELAVAEGNFDAIDLVSPLL